MIDGVTLGEQITFGGKTHSMEYMRDENGEVYGFIYDRSTYFLEKNALGDVKYLLDGSGNVLAKYTYDEWGKKVSVTDASGNSITDGTNIAHLNPFRYRSYCYDDETGLYYLNSRYYDPCTGRFVNADNLVAGIGDSVTGYNLFSYCFNNPVNMDDPSGNWPKWVGKAIAVVAVAAVVVAAVAVTVSTFGAGSVAGVAAITAAITIAARATEVAVLQVKKSKSSSNNSNNIGGKTSDSNNLNNENNSSSRSNTNKNGGQVAVDVVESLFDNGLQIIGITPLTKTAGIGVNHVLNQQIATTFGETTALSSTLSAVGGKLVPYAFSAYAWVNTAISIFSDDPVQRANKRGYTLK